MAEKDPTGVSAVFARNVRLRRISNGISQTELAKRMKSEGFPFHQQTIQRIEDGERPVKLDEAMALSDIFGVDVRIMSLDRSRMRLREVSEAVATGSLELIDGTWRGLNEWRDNCKDLYWQLDDDLDQGTVNVRRLQAGRSILQQVVEQTKLAEDRARELQAKFFAPAITLLQPDDAAALLEEDEEEGEERSDEDAKRNPGLREYEALLEAIPPDAAYANFSITELMQLYINPDDERARELLGDDFGPEPTDDSDASDMFLRERSSRK